MRLAKLQRGAWAAVTNKGAVDLSSAFDGDIREHLDAQSLQRLAEFAAGREPDIGGDELSYAPFLPNPEKIICVGVNYANRNEEYRDGSDLPKYPSLFLRAPTSFVGHDAPLLRPQESEQLDYEGELAIIIGKGGRRVPKEHALGHIAGLTLVNEGTLRDWVRHAKFNVTQGKNFDSSGSIGPWMVTADEFAGFEDIAVQTRVNGEVRQDDSTASLIFGFADLIAYISSFTTLKAGDVISTGTPPGAGARLDPPVYLKPGDMIEVSSPQIGTLRNGVADG
ncbi:MAG: fumarylacetoacetate hydrolase family protein [Sphingomonas sp.]|nr:fumarylacetoacetate hydrolase family protein [Sphingomonas sp.]